MIYPIKRSDCQTIRLSNDQIVKRSDLINNFDDKHLEGNANDSPDILCIDRDQTFDECQELYKRR